jgi:TetR/AcrR family transcriptional regulator, repressor for neighboring sulfatase
MPKSRSRRASESPGDSGTVPSRPRASREETTERILDAAQELFSARNPRDVTVREIAERAGVTHALVHQYVGTKNDLLNAVIQRVSTDRVSIVRRSDTLREAVDALAHDVLRNRMHSRALVRSAMDGVEYVSLKERIPTGGAVKALALEMRESGVQPADPPTDLDYRVVLAAITAMLFGWTATEDWLRPSYGVDDIPTEELQHQIAEIAVYLTNLVLVSREPA